MEARSLVWAVPVRLTILGSGSAGNCAYVETEETRILVDAGFSAKQIELRLNSIGRSLADVQAIFLTHEHGDHVCGLPVLTKRHAIPVYCNRLTAEYLQPEMPHFSAWRLFDSGATIKLADLKVDTFSVPHDAYDPVGFMFHHALGNIGFLTDLGYATKLVIERVRQARALVLEANHDLKLLQEDTKRPWSVKQRILSRHGHLSNEAAGDVAAEVVTDLMEDLYLGHLSSDCNSPQHARTACATGLSVARRTMGMCGRGDVSYREMEVDGVQLPVIEAHCEYRKPARYDDDLEIRTSATLLTPVRIRFDYEIVRGGRETLVIGHTVHAAVDPSGRPRRLPPRVREMVAPAGPKGPALR